MTITDPIYARRLSEATLGQLQAYPEDASPSVAVTSPNTDWGYGNYATLIAAGQITFPFYIVIIRAYDNIAAQAGLHEVELYYGPDDVQFGNWKFLVDSAGNYVDSSEVIMGAAGGDPIPGGSRIRAKVAYELGLTTGVSVALFDLHYKQVNG
jgi:hypothetical protein